MVITLCEMCFLVLRDSLFGCQSVLVLVSSSSIIVVRGLGWGGGVF